MKTGLLQSVLNTSDKNPSVNTKADYRPASSSLIAAASRVLQAELDEE